MKENSCQEMKKQLNNIYKKNKEIGFDLDEFNFLRKIILSEDTQLHIQAVYYFHRFQARILQRNQHSLLNKHIIQAGLIPAFIRLMQSGHKGLLFYAIKIILVFISMRRQRQLSVLIHAKIVDALARIFPDAQIRVRRSICHILRNIQQYAELIPSFLANLPADMIAQFEQDQGSGKLQVFVRQNILIMLLQTESNPIKLQTLIRIILDSIQKNADTGLQIQSILRSVICNRVRIDDEFLLTSGMLSLLMQRILVPQLTMLCIDIFQNIIKRGYIKQLINLGIIQTIQMLMVREQSSIRLSLCNILSNLFSSDATVIKIIQGTSIIDSLLLLLANDDKQIKKKAYYVLKTARCEQILEKQSKDNYLRQIGVFFMDILNSLDISYAWYFILVEKLLIVSMKQKGIITIEEQKYIKNGLQKLMNAADSFYKPFIHQFFQYKLRSS